MSKHVISSSGGARNLNPIGLSVKVQIKHRGTLVAAAREEMELRVWELRVWRRKQKKFGGLEWRNRCCGENDTLGFFFFFFGFRPSVLARSFKKKFPGPKRHRFAQVV